MGIIEIQGELQDEQTCAFMLLCFKRTPGLDKTPFP